MSIDDAPLPEESILVLHEIRLRGVLDAPPAEHGEILVARGYLERRGARTVLTTRGRELHEAWVRVEVGSQSERRITSVYEHFRPLNTQLLDVSTAWQVRPGNVANDHSDPAYDWSVIDRLVALDERAGPLVARAGDALARFAAYRPRLRQARRRVEEGEHDWFLSPRCDSYHTVWMQLHEDLLLALGIPRGDEAPRGRPWQDSSRS
ncbi:MAG TPA: hypothetical protein VF152_02930 [Acidimicrobiia bacterium]